MKSWYVVFDDCEVMCPFVSMSAQARVIVLDYKGINVKLRFNNFNQEYSAAKSGELTSVYAVSPLGRNKGKPVKIVFK